MQSRAVERSSWLRSPTARARAIAGGGAWGEGPLTGLRHFPAVIAGWLRCDVLDVVSLGRRWRSSRRSQSKEQGLDLVASLRSFRRAAGLARLVSVLRRWIIVAVIVALVLALVRWRIAPLPLWAALAPPLGLAAIGAIIMSFRSTDPAAVARLLDRRLMLKEQVSSALEAPPTGNVLAGRLQARAGKLAVRARSDWRVRPIGAVVEWTALAGGLIVLALLLTVARPATSAVHRAVVYRVHVATATHVGGIRTTVVSIGPISSSTQPTGSRRIARQLALQARGSGNNGQRQSAASSHKGRNGTVIPPGRASEAAFPTRKQTSLGASSGSHASGSQSGANLVTSRRGVTSPPPRSGPGKTGSSNNTVSIKGPRLANSNNGGTSNRTASGRASKVAGGVAGRGGVAQRNPYGKTPSYLRNLPKPGLVTGPALSSKGNTNGSNLAGRGRGANGRASSRHLTGGKGRQLSLTSSYGSSAGSTQKRSTLTAPAGQHRTAHVRGGRGGTGASDYIPPDANSVGQDESHIVVRYFAPTGKQ